MMNLTVYEGMFWQRVYLAAITSGDSHGDSCAAADMALKAYRERALVVKSWASVGG